jgi:hypothetical protein
MNAINVTEYGTPQLLFVLTEKMDSKGVGRKD